MSTRRYQILGDIVTGAQLDDKLKGYIPSDDNAEIVSWVEVDKDNNLVISMKNGQESKYKLSGSKDFDNVEYDLTTGYLHFYSKEGADVYDPVYIGGGQGTGQGTEVRLTNQNGTTALVGSYGSAITLMFTFTSLEDDLETGNGTCKIIVNGITKHTTSIPQGLNAIDVAPYLAVGSNTVKVTCMDTYGISKSLTYEVTVIKLTIESTFNAAVTYNGDITFKYTPYGAVEKTVHFLVDGNNAGTVVTSLTGKQLTKTFTKMSHGVHRLEVYSTAMVNDTEIKSPSLLYDIICIEDGDQTPIIASVYNTKELEQGAMVAIPYLVYDPTRLACDVTLTIYTLESGSEVVYANQTITVDRSQQTWYTRKYPVGTVYFRVAYGDINKTHMVTVIESSIKVEPETNDLELQLTSEGRSNNETNPGQWTYGDVSTTFENFNWKNNGWIDDEHGDTCLRLNGDAKAEIQFQPFKDDIRTYGKTIELDFTIRDVNERDATVITCMSGGIGFEVKADMARIKSEQSEVFCRYKDDDDDRDNKIEKVRLAFVVESRDEYRQLCVYLNGILSDEIQYPTTDNFQQTTPVNITIGSSKCGIDLYTVRSYSTALTAQQVINNRIADIKDVVEKAECFERNDIYDDYGNISYEKCLQKNSIMVVIGELPTYKGDKKIVKVVYYDIEDSTLNFADVLVTIDVQGTSSQWYVIKNFKLKCSEEHAIDAVQVLTKVFCIKVDYAESTGKHNTGTANFVHTLYSETIPPQEDNSLVRTTIWGKPILLFHQADENSDPVFYSKANFNFDKGSLEAFAFNDNYDVESWEFCNNTSDACNFLGEVPEIWVDDFESRYPEDYTDIERFKEMHSWVVSTKDDLEKFKMEFENHFNMHYTLIYYVWTLFALMMDQRAKNMFLTYWDKSERWYPYLYDNDSIFGINNEGRRVFEYYLEDTDQLDGMNVYNGQNSVLWNNFRMGFPDKIKETWQSLRNSGKITYEKLVEAYLTNHADKWSEAIYNEDAYAKYIRMLIEDNDATNLPQVRGKAEEDFKYWIANRLDFCDSKWYAGDYVNNFVTLRIYTPSEWTAIEPNADVTVTYFSTIYGGMRYKANGTLLQEKVSAGVPLTFNAPDETFNDTETAIYGAHLVSSLGDLAPLYAGSINVAPADKLIELKAGDSTEGYSNPNLKELSVGTNKLLRLINVCNCPNFTSVLDLSGCPSIEEVYATGSGITGVNFPEAGILKIVELPATITNLSLMNQLYIESLTLEGYDAIKTIRIENCPTVASLDILSKSANVERVRLTNVDWNYDTAAEVLALADRNLAGIDENGVNTDTMWIDGKCHIKALTGAEYLEIKDAFPYLTITYDSLTAVLTFKSDDGSENYGTQTIQNGGDGSYSGTTPTKASTAQYDHTFGGWSLTPGGDPDPDALKNVEADRIVYAAYIKTLRSYTVKFYNGTTLLQTSTVQYGGDAVYSGSTPVNNSSGNPADFEFYGWNPAPTNIQGDTNCYAQFYDLREIKDSWATIAANVANGTATSKYAIGAFKTLDIGEVSLPYDFNQGSAVVYNGEIHILGSVISEYRTSHYKWNGIEWVEASTIPYEFYYGSAVVYNNEIHILGGSSSSTARTKHYKWDGSKWTSVSTLPYVFDKGVAIVYDNEIHIMGSRDSSNYTSHYKWNGSAWSEVGKLPYSFYTASGFIYNNEIHVLGSYDSKYETAHYKYDGSSWTSVSTLPQKLSNGHALVVGTDIYMIQWDEFYKYDGTNWGMCSNVPANVYDGRSVVLDGCIYVMGSSVSENGRVFYSYSPETETWSKVGITESIPMQVIAHNHDELADGVMKWENIGTSLPIIQQYGCAVVLNDEIHVLGGNNATTYARHLKWDATNSSWVTVSTLPYQLRSGCAVVLNNEIHILGSYQTSNKTEHYKWNGTEWTSVSTLPYAFYCASAVVFNGEIHILGSYNNSNRKSHYKWNGTEWVSVSTLSYNFYYGSAIVYGDEIHIFGGSGASTGHYKWNETNGWTEVSTLPHDFSSGAAGVLNNEIHIFGGSDVSTEHHKYNGTEWVSVSTLPDDFYNSPLAICNNTPYIFIGMTCYKLSGPSWEEQTYAFPDSSILQKLQGSLIVERDNLIHIISGSPSSKNALKHFVYDGNEITQLVYELPICFGGGSAVVYNNEIHAFGGSNVTAHYKWDGNVTWTEVSTLPVDAVRAVVYNDELHLFGWTEHYKWTGAEWILVSTLPYSARFGIGLVIYNDEMHILGGVYGQKKHHKWDATSSKWVSISALPYAAQYNHQALVYKDEIHLLGGENYETAHYKWDGTEWVEVEVMPFEINNAHGGCIVFREHIHAFIHHQAHYVLRNPRATLTFLAGNAMAESRKMYNNTHYYGGWSTSELRTWCNEDLFNKLPSELQNGIKLTSKLSDGGYNNLSIVKTYDNIWIPSIDELGFESDNTFILGQGYAYSVFTDNASRKKYLVDNTTVINWWTRSHTKNDKGGFRYIMKNGWANNMGQNANAHPLIGFCI